MDIVPIVAAQRLRLGKPGFAFALVVGVFALPFETDHQFDLKRNQVTAGAGVFDVERLSTDGANTLYFSVSR